MFNKIRRTFARWSDNPTDYYSNLPEKQRLSKCYKIRVTLEEPAYTTNVPIQFHGVPMSSPAKSYRAALGKPYHSTKRKYHNSAFTSMVFNQEFCGLKATSIVNLLDDDMLNSVYYLDASDKLTIRKIKEAIRLKYGIDHTDLPDYFVLADASGGRLTFDCTLNTMITYFPVNEALNEKIELTLNACKNTRQIQGKQKQEEFAFAF